MSAVARKAAAGCGALRCRRRLHANRDHGHDTRRPRSLAAPKSTRGGCAAEPRRASAGELPGEGTVLPGGGTLKVCALCGCSGRTGGGASSVSAEDDGSSGSGCSLTLDSAVVRDGLEGSAAVLVLQYVRCVVPYV